MLNLKKKTIKEIAHAHFMTFDEVRYAYNRATIINWNSWTIYMLRVCIHSQGTFLNSQCKQYSWRLVFIFKGKITIIYISSSKYRFLLFLNSFMLYNKNFKYEECKKYVACVVKECL